MSGFDSKRTASRDLLEPQAEPVAYFDFQDFKFSWAKHMQIGPVPVSIKVEPVALYLEAPQQQAEPVATFQDGVLEGQLREREYWGKQQAEPVAWQWLNSAVYRKKLPKFAEAGAWNPLYAAPQAQPPAPAPDLKHCACEFDGDTCVSQCKLHGAHVDAIHEWAERAKAAEAKLAAQPAVAEPLIDEMDAVASRYAHKLALDLECVLSNYIGPWYDTAMQTLSDYRMAMNRIHEHESPTFMGEPDVRNRTSGGSAA